MSIGHRNCWLAGNEEVAETKREAAGGVLGKGGKKVGAKGSRRA